MKKSTNTQNLGSFLEEIIQKKNGNMLNISNFLEAKQKKCKFLGKIRFPFKQFCFLINCISSVNWHGKRQSGFGKSKFFNFKLSTLAV